MKKSNKRQKTNQVTQKLISVQSMYQVTYIATNFHWLVDLVNDVMDKLEDWFK